METIEVLDVAVEATIIDAKYPLRSCLAEGERRAVYETSYLDQPAIIKIFYPRSSRDASELLAGFAAARNLHHPNLLTVFDFGRAEIEGHEIVYIVTERADENLGAVLRGRILDDEEARDVLNGLVPVLEHLHGHGYIHSRIRPSNILACGNTLKLSSDRLRPLTATPTVVEPPGLHDAPETGQGLFSPACDVWSLAVVTLEALTGSPLESSAGHLHQPFRRIVEGGLIRDPKRRWTLAQTSQALRGESTRSERGASQRDAADNREEPRYRKLAVWAIGGALAAGALCIMLIRGAHQPPGPPPVVVAPASTAARAVSGGSAAPVPVATPSPFDTIPAGWAIVGAAYHRQGDAEKRAASMRKEHPGLNARVVAADSKGHRFLVVFATGLAEAQAKLQLGSVRRAGAPRGTYITRFR